MFTQQQNNIITGLLLGDGCLRKKLKSKNATLVVKRAQADYDYSKYHVDIFGDYVTASGLKQLIKFDKRNNKNYYACEYALKACEELLDYYNRWYPDGKKIVPRDLELNGEIIATWFCDDGTIKKSKNNYFDISFATNGFSIEDVDYLQKLLSDRYQVRIGICKAKNNQRTIHLSDYATRRLIVDIDPYFPKGMERKRKWEGLTFGKEHTSHLLSSKDKDDKVKEFIQNNKEFYLIDITKCAGAKLNRSDGRLEWDTQNIKRYLQKYINQNIIKFDHKDHKGCHYSRVEDS